MSKLYDGITIIGTKRIFNTKASESYVPVEFKYSNEIWEGWVPVEYRRTGVEIAEDDSERLIEHLNNVYEQMNPANYRAWYEKQNIVWEHSKSDVTKKIFEILCDGKWHCRNCEIDNPNFARRIQDLYGDNIERS